MPDETLTDAQIDALIACPKHLESEGRRRRDAQHMRLDYQLRGDAEGQHFVLFTRQNIRIADDFSAGLRWCTASGTEVILVRCNGSSHRHRNALEDEEFFDRCHVHRATERYAGSGRRVDTFAVASDRFRTLAGALHHLTEIANISGVTTSPDSGDLFPS